MEDEQLSPEDRSQTFVEHLDELRTRIIRTAIYLAAGMVVCWSFYKTIFVILLAPVISTLKEAESSFQALDIMEGFMVRAQMSLIAGLTLALPFVLIEIWLFVRPGLTKRERRYFRIIPTVIVILFLSGMAFGYRMAPVFVSFLLSDYFIIPDIMKVELRAQAGALFMARMLLAFGIGFQLPVVMVALNRIGILPLSLLTRKWREAIMVIFLISALLTPTPDPINMFLVAMPLGILYYGTLVVIKIMERRDRKAAAKDSG